MKLAEWLTSWLQPGSPAPDSFEPEVVVNGNTPWRAQALGELEAMGPDRGERLSPEEMARLSEFLMARDPVLVNATLEAVVRTGLYDRHVLTSVERLARKQGAARDNKRVLLAAGVALEALRAREAALRAQQASDTRFLLRPARPVDSRSLLRPAATRDPTPPEALLRPAPDPGHDGGRQAAEPER